MKSQLWRGALLLAAMLAATGCKKKQPDQQQQVPPVEEDAGTNEVVDSGTPGRTITGAIDVDYWNGNDVKSSLPADTSQRFLYAYADVNGQAVELPATWTTGGYKIDGIPLSGPYWIRLFEGDGSGDRYFYADGDGPDFSSDRRGRSDVAIATNKATTVAMDAGSLDTWQDGDELEMSAGNLGFAKSVVPTYFTTNGPIAGDTSLSHLTMGWGNFPLLEEARGDSLVVAQIRHIQDATNNVNFATPIKTMNLPPFTMQNGQSSFVTGNFTDAPAYDYTLEWKRTAWYALKSKIHPNATDPTFQDFKVIAIPGGANRGEITEWHPRVIDNLFLPQDLTDLSMTLHAHNPYPASWLVHRFYMSFNVDLQWYDGNYPTGMAGEIGEVRLDMPSAASPELPPLEPVGSFKIAGKTLEGNLTGVGVRPELTWTAPSQGATSYEILVQEAKLVHADVPGPGPHLRVEIRDLATIVLPGDLTKITVPPDMLDASGTYLFRIRAVKEANQDVRKAPFKHSLPTAWADAWSSFVRP